MSEPYRIKLEGAPWPMWPWQATVYRPGEDFPDATFVGASRDEAAVRAHTYIRRLRDPQSIRPEWIEVPA